MTARVLLIHALAVTMAAGWWAASVSAQAPSSGRTAAGAAAGSWSSPLTPWGDPDIQGTYTNKDENGTPLERPAELAGKNLQDFGPREMAALQRERQQRAQANAGRIGGTQDEDTGAGPPHWYEHLDAQNSQPWLVIDPPDGRVPPLTEEAQQRASARQAARRGRGQADSWEDRSLYDRCISRGLPGSMMPAIYGNAYDIVQAPGYVAIRYEMIHETRIIPVDGRAPLAPSLRSYMGEARGRWEGNTLVVETTNLNGRTAYRGSSDRLKITERFTPIDANTLRWEVRFEDPATWERPWAFAMPLKRDDGETRVFEYACHEGNRGLEYILRAARAEEQDAANAR